MQVIQDFKDVTCRHIMEYTVNLISKTQIESDYYVFDFTKPEDFSFFEGQFAKFELIDSDIDDKKFRLYSIASTNEDNLIRVSTKISATHSLYKNELLKLNPGDSMQMTGPMGKFTLQDNIKAVFIAGGIGITPIRSILLSERCKRRDFIDELIYSEIEKTYPFKDELQTLGHLNISYAANIEPTQKLIREAVNKNMNNAFYYISGSPGFVKEINRILKSGGIEPFRIKFDVFTGY